MRSLALFGTAPALALSGRTEPARASFADAAPLAPADAEPANVLFYIAGWETPDSADSAADEVVPDRIAIRLDRAWRAARY